MTNLVALNPLFLTLLPLAALPILFHLFFRLKKQTRPFSTLMFFHRIDPRLNARRRLREWLVLLLRALLILFLLLALARPIWFGIGKEGAVAVVLVIDNSGSMSGAGAGGLTKVKQAVEAARAVIAELRDQDSAGLALLVPDPTVPLPPGLTRDKAALKLALDSVSGTEAGGSAAAAVERATVMIDGSAAAHLEIHVLTDLQQEKWGQAPAGLRAPRRSVSFIVHRLSSPSADQPNVSLLGVQMPSRPVIAGRRFPVRVRLANPGASEASVRLNWLDDSGGGGSQELVVPPQAEKTAALNLDAPNPGLRWLLFSIDGDDFTADNRAAAAFVCAEKLSIWFAGDATDFGYLPLALSPGGDGRLSGLATSFSDLDSINAAIGGQSGGLVALTWDGLFDSSSGAAARLAALHRYLTAGGRVLLLPPLSGSASTGTKPDWLAVTPGAVQTSNDGLALSVRDQANPLFDDLRDEHGEVALRNVKVFRFQSLRVLPSVTPLLGLEDGQVVMAEQKVGNGLVLASGLAFDPKWSTLPLKPGFVALAQAMALDRADAKADIRSVVAGDPFRAGTNDTEMLQVQSLGGSPMDWKGKVGQFTTFPRVGVYTGRLGQETRWIAVRSADQEGRRKFIASDTVPALGQLNYSVENFAGGEAVRSEFRKLGRSLDLSAALLLLALGCLAGEGWLANPSPLKSRPSPTGAAPGLSPAA